MWTKNDFALRSIVYSIPEPTETQRNPSLLILHHWITSQTRRDYQQDEIAVEEGNN
jgi:hypothetical protein